MFDSLVYVRWQVLCTVTSVNFRSWSSFLSLRLILACMNLAMPSCFMTHDNDFVIGCSQSKQFLSSHCLSFSSSSSLELWSCLNKNIIYDEKCKNSHKCSHAFEWQSLKLHLPKRRRFRCIHLVTTLKEMLGIYQPYEYSCIYLSNPTKYIWQLIKNIAAIVLHMFGIHIQAKLIQANLGFWKISNII